MDGSSLLSYLIDLIATTLACSDHPYGRRGYRQHLRRPPFLPNVSESQPVTPGVFPWPLASPCLLIPQPQCVATICYELVGIGVEGLPWLPEVHDV